MQKQRCHNTFAYFGKLRCPVDSAMVVPFGVATFLLMLALPGLLLGQSDFRYRLPFQITGWLCAIPGLIISYWTAFAYIPVIRANLRDGRADRAHKDLAL